MTDPSIIDQGRVFSEAVRQTEPLAAAGSREGAQAGRAVRDTDYFDRMKAHEDLEDSSVFFRSNAA